MRTDFVYTESEKSVIRQDVLDTLDLEERYLQVQAMKDVLDKAKQTLTTKEERDAFEKQNEEDYRFINNELRRLINELTITPSYLQASGYNRHCEWLLEEDGPKEN